MDRLSLRHGYLLLALPILLLIGSVLGCRTAALTAAYLIKGTNVDAKFEGLREKRVAVVCRPVSAILFRHDVSGDLAREIGELLQRNVREIEVVDNAKVREFTDETAWDEFSEIGEYVEADMVVGIDLEDFSIFNQGQSLYQGRASATIWVYDCTEGGADVYKAELPETLYPPNAAIPAMEMPETRFRSRFVRVLADQIGRHFYPHDGYSDFARDTEGLQR